MTSRSSLQTLLEQKLGSLNVYYQPPTSVKMNYPAIVYSKANIAKEYANGKAYLRRNSYQIIVIDRQPDNQVIEKLLELPYCSYDRHYVSDNLNHDVLTIYY